MAWHLFVCIYNMSGAEERNLLVAVANPGLSSQAASPRPSTQVGDATTPITTTTTTTTTQCVNATTPITATTTPTTQVADATTPITATTTPTTQVAGATTPITATTTTTQASGSKNAAVRVYDQSSKKAKGTLRLFHCCRLLPSPPPSFPIRVSFTYWGPFS